MSTKAKGLGLFSKLSRKSVTDLSEWNKNDERLMQCVETSDLKEIVTLLKKKKVCSTKLDPQGHSALHVAAMRNKFDVVQLLIAYSANITAIDFQGRTALHCAARHSASEVLEVLTQSKEDEWPKDESSMTALHHACIGGNLDCVINLLRKYPKDIKAGDEDGRTPLFYSAQIGHFSVCKELLDRGANINTQDKFRRTALMCAAENGNRQICELFVKSGANVDLFDEMGRSAAWYAMDAGHTAVKQTIEPSEEDEITNLTLNENNNSIYIAQADREHSPIPEESESVMGDDTLSLRFRQSGSRLELSKLSDDEEDFGDVDLTNLSSVDSDDEFKASTLSGGSDYEDDDGSISPSPRLSELSYTMSSHTKEERSTSHDSGVTSLMGLSSSGRRNSKTSSISSSTSMESQSKYRVPSGNTAPDPATDLLRRDSGLKKEKRLIPVTDLDADETPTSVIPSQQTSRRKTPPHVQYIFSSTPVDSGVTMRSKVTDLDADSSNSDSRSKYLVNTELNNISHETKQSPRTVESLRSHFDKQSDNDRKQHQKVSSGSHNHPQNRRASTGNKPHHSKVDESGSQPKSADILLSSEGISLSTDTDVSEVSDDETVSVSISESTKSAHSKRSLTPASHDQALAAAHTELKEEYNSLMSEYEEIQRRLAQIERDKRRQSEEEQRVTEHMDMVLQLSELSSRLDDEEEKNRMLESRISTLQKSNDLADGSNQTTPHTGDKSAAAAETVDENSWSEDSDDEFGFPDMSKRDDTRPVAKVSARPRQMSLKEENREIAKLKLEIESLERQKYSLTEALTQLQSKYEDSEHGRKKLISELDISRTTLDVKNHENSQLVSEAADLRQQVAKYKDRAVTAVDQTKSYKKEVEKLGRKLELYDKEYRKVKERLKRKDANEKRMLKDRHAMMRKLDEATRRMREAEKTADTHRKADNEEVDQLLIRCEALETELGLLKDFNEDQSYEIERLTELSSCSEEMLNLKQLEIQSLEKQINLIKDVSAPPQRRDSFRDTQLTITSLQEQITKLQSQLAATAANSQETIDMYRNHLIMASKNMLDPDIKEALQYILELRQSC